MPVTSTAFTACDAVIELSDGVALRDISGSMNTVDANFENQIGEFRVFGSQWKQRIQCGKDASFTIKGVATTGANEIREIIEEWFFSGSGPRAFQFSAEGTSVGDVRYSAQVVLKNFKFNLDAGSSDPVMFDIELSPNGEVIREIIA